MREHQKIGAARRLRAQMTDAERVLWERLRAHRFLGLGFRRQAPVGPFIVDFLCHERKLIIEVDGGQHADAAQAAMDARRTEELERQGFRVLRFWNNEVLGNIDGVLERLAEECGRPLPAPPPRAGEGAQAGGAAPAPEAQRAEPKEQTIPLDHAARHFRRRVFEAEGRRLLVDLPEARAFRDGETVAATDGTVLTIRAAPEPLLEVRGPALARLAWHIGNRHTPCQVEPDRLLIRRDPVLADMLERLGATLREVEEPFEPEGGAYGHGRTHGHSHSHDPHADPNAHIPHRHDAADD